MSIREISFPSANGRDTIKAWAYAPLGKPRAVIQLIHGFGEHSRRYLHMISAFQAAGFAVYADDHIGHGKTGYDGGTLGDPHSGGYMTYLKDEKSLHDIAGVRVICSYIQDVYNLYDLLQQQDDLEVVTVKGDAE